MSKNTTVANAATTTMTGTRRGHRRSQNNARRARKRVWRMRAAPLCADPGRAELVGIGSGEPNALMVSISSRTPPEGASPNDVWA